MHSKVAVLVIKNCSGRIKALNKTIENPIFSSSKWEKKSKNWFRKL